MGKFIVCMRCLKDLESKRNRHYKGKGKIMRDKIELEDRSYLRNR